MSKKEIGQIIGGLIGLFFITYGVLYALSVI